MCITYKIYLFYKIIKRQIKNLILSRNLFTKNTKKTLAIYKKIWAKI